MPDYMTPAFFKRMPTGIDVSAKTDDEIARILSMAASEVNRYCAAPKHPKPHDFRGDTVSLEQHIWDLGNNYRPGSDRLYLLHTPVKAVSQFTLRVTSDQVVNFSPADIYINNHDGYIEIISLARRLSVFSAGFVPVIGLRQPVAELYYSYGYSFSVTDEAMYPDADGDLKLFRAANQWWTADAVTVYVNGVAKTETTDYTLDRDEGTVTFTSQVANGAGVTVGYTYKLPEEIRDAMGIIAANIAEAERFIAGGFTSLTGIKAEEAELRFNNRKAGILDGVVDGRAQSLLDSFRFRSWG